MLQEEIKTGANSNPGKAVKNAQRIGWKAREVNVGRGKISKIFAL